MAFREQFSRMEGGALIPIFIATGHSGSGKSTLLSVAREAYQNYGLFPETITDRNLLSQAVAEDMMRGFSEVEVSPGKQARVSEHAILYRDHDEPGLRVFTVRDGVLLNDVHRRMRDIICDNPNEQGLVIEWTTGPNVEVFPVLQTGGEGLYQDAESFLRLFSERSLDEDRRVLVIAVNADLEFRVARNLRRPDPMEPSDFARIFRDGGELRAAHLQQFSERFVFKEYSNNYDNERRFFREMNHLCGRELSSLIEGNRPNPERRDG